jgi:two-component system CheB/CheR fusion protein
MPAALMDHWAYRIRTDGAKGPDGLQQDVGEHLNVICAILNSRLGRNFSLYKSNTLMRRVQRRMQILQSENVEAYVEQLRRRPDEPEQLFREFLIRVTQFFRDPSAFEALARKIPDILSRDGDQDVRIWVPGCATGEEAYTLAILFKEAMSREEKTRRIQIFATDIDDEALRIARTGYYPRSISADLPADLLERYFVEQDDGYRVSKELREMCLFSTHDLVKDPPFSRLSLISCRNLMIYFGAALQKRVVSIFHYGLRSGGALFLGSSEAVTAHASLFSTADKKHRIFERRSTPAQMPRLAAMSPMEQQGPVTPVISDGQVAAQVQRVVSRYSPAFVVMDRRQNIQQLSGQIGKYLAPSDGAMSMNLGILVHAQLRGPLRAALEKVVATGHPVIEQGVCLEIAGRTEAVTIAIEPLRYRHSAPGEDLVVVVFQDLGPARAGGVGQEAPSGDELAGAREHLQTLAELLETSNEELQSSNEEYQSVNEELQSTNEELETSKEELQSINEELTTLNAELNARNDNLVELNSDLTNLIDSTSIATLFLDKKLRIRRFTPSVRELFRVRDGDQGRSIKDIVSRLEEEDFGKDAVQVLRTLVPVQRQVDLATGDRSFQMEIRPYRGGDDVINGVVITFVDITDRERAEKARANLAAIIDSSEDTIISHDLDGVITSWNASASTLLGYSDREMVGQPISLIVPESERKFEPDLLNNVCRGERIDHYDTTLVRKDTSVVEVSQSLSPVRGKNGQIVGAARILRDITATRRSRE